MKNLYLLPTEKPSRLHTWINDKGLRATLYEKPQLENPNTAKNIYITADERPNSDEYYIIDDIYEVLKNDFLKSIDNNCKKIVLTTDQDLIKDGVQEINDEFLEWFVKNPNCDFVRTLKVPYFDESSHSYVLIIPKEEDFELVSIGEKTVKLAIPMIQDKEEIKQETLEEAAERFLKNGAKEFKTAKQVLIEFAKWQQEQDKNLYNEEEMIEFADFYYQYKELIKLEKWEIIEVSKKDVFKKWFEQFKKK